MRTAIIVDGVTSTTTAGRPSDGIVETHPATLRHNLLTRRESLLSYALSAGLLGLEVHFGKGLGQGGTLLDAKGLASTEEKIPG
jgi:hypothetical protein